VGSEVGHSNPDSARKQCLHCRVETVLCHECTQHASPFSFGLYFFYPLISVSSNGQHTVYVPLHSLSFVPTLLILSVFPFALSDKVKQLLWGRGNVIGLLMRVSTNYFFIPLHRSLVVFLCQSCFTSCLAC
jgi:hypothetical protein